MGGRPSILSVPRGKRLPAAPTPPKPAVIRGELEGELFAGHSFSNIIGQLALRFAEDREIELAIARRFYNPTDDRDALDERKLLEYVDGK